jgi:hypothetical protein
MALINDLTPWRDETMHAVARANLRHAERHLALAERSLRDAADDAPEPIRKALATHAVEVQTLLRRVGLIVEAEGLARIC